MYMKYPMLNGLALNATDKQNPGEIFSPVSVGYSGRDFDYDSKEGYIYWVERYRPNVSYI